jgi:prephenate dehydrogenase
LPFVAGHPIAGAAAAGFQHARADLFANRPWMLCPPPDGNLHRVDEFVQALGAAAHVIDADAHDELVAFLSHLPQLAASTLMAVVGDAIGDGGLAFSGRGLQDTTRLAASPAEMWKQICGANADRIGPALDKYIQLLQDVRENLTNSDVVDRVFTAAQRWKAQMPH